MSQETVTPSLDWIDSARVAEIRRVRLRSRRSVSADLLGQYRSAFRGSGLVFNEIREYQPGDDVKHIHWRATARTNTVYVKSYQEDRQLSIVVASDISASMGFGAPKSRYNLTLEFAAVVARLAELGNDLIGLALFSDNIKEFLPPKGSRSHRNAVFSALGKSRTLPKSTNLATSLSELRALLRRPSIIFVISDFLCPQFEQELKQLSARHDVILVQVGAEQAYDLPACGMVQFRDAESGALKLIDTSDKTARRSLEEIGRKHSLSLKTLASQCGVDFISILDDPIKPLLQLTHQRLRRQV